ncbi:hypothetical protein C8R44DRAFT_742594 [Mycena epipterygia]|nr:hypothetical protein C8R44DRAFT_742594 [Mycena epipterygia]
MSPFAGEGANTAMRSGKELAEKEIVDWDLGIQRYERDRFKYASVLAKEFADNLEMAYQDDAAQKCAAFFKQASTFFSGQICAKFCSPTPNPLAGEQRSGSQLSARHFSRALRQPVIYSRRDAKFNHMYFKSVLANFTAVPDALVKFDP